MKRKAQSAERKTDAVRFALSAAGLCVFRFPLERFVPQRLPMCGVLRFPLARFPLCRPLPHGGALQVRFNPPDAQLQELEPALAAIAEEDRLRRLFRATLQAESLATFQADMEAQRTEATLPVIRPPSCVDPRPRLGLVR